MKMFEFKRNKKKTNEKLNINKKKISTTEMTGGKG